MSRILALSILAATLVGPGAAQDREALATDLHRFVDAFELAEVSAVGYARLQTIVDHSSASHAAKVLAIHDVLKAQGALRHRDMHGVKPTLHSRLRN